MREPTIQDVKTAEARVTAQMKDAVEQADELHEAACALVRESEGEPALAMAIL